MQIYDVIIIGGGPAGLAALHFLSMQGLKVYLFERGETYEKRIREKKNGNINAFSIANGLGGAGLLYDGKYSFSPSASYFWSNVDSAAAKRSYNTIYKIIKDAGIPLPFPKWSDEWTIVLPGIKGEKYYKSVYFSSEAQSKLIKNLCANNLGIGLNTEIISICKKNESYVLVTSNNMKYQANNILIATGKHGASLLTESNILCDYTFKLEIGVRIECDYKIFLPDKNNAADYKLIVPIDENAQVRTFCCCKRGNVLKSFSGKFYSYNGEKAYGSSKKSNIGLLLRTESSESIYATEIKKLLQNVLYAELPLQDFLYKGIEIIGKNSDIVIKKLIEMIVDIDNHKGIESAILYTPEIEYIGSYPYFDPKTLKIANESIWVAGDVSGKYRGLLAALVSGIYAAEDILRRF